MIEWESCQEGMLVFKKLVELINSPPCTDLPWNHKGASPYWNQWKWRSLNESLSYPFSFRAGGEEGVKGTMLVDLSTLCVMDHLWPIIYVYIYIYIYIHIYNWSYIYIYGCIYK